MLVGGRSLFSSLKDIPIPVYYVEAEESGIFQALNNARDIADAIDNERYYNKVIRIFLEHFKGGVAAVDKDARVFLSNIEFNGMLGLPELQIYGSRIDNLYPQLDMSDVLRSRQSGKPVLLKLGGVTYICDKIPVIMDEKVVGCLALMQRVFGAKNRG